MLYDSWLWFVGHQLGPPWLPTEVVRPEKHSSECSLSNQQSILPTGGTVGKQGVMQVMDSTASNPESLMHTRQLVLIHAAQGHSRMTGIHAPGGTGASSSSSQALLGKRKQESSFIGRVGAVCLYEEEECRNKWDCVSKAVCIKYISGCDLALLHH